MEDHGYWQEQLSAFVDGELSPEEEAELREHLEGCAGCRSALALLRGMTGALASAEEKPPAALPEGTRFLFEREKTDRKFILKRWRFTAIAAVVCLALLGFGTQAPRLFGGNTAKTEAVSAPMAIADESPTASLMEADEAEPAPAEAQKGATLRASGGGMPTPEPAPQAPAAADSAVYGGANSAWSGETPAEDSGEAEETSPDAASGTSPYYMFSTEGLPGYAIYQELENAGGWYSVCFVYGEMLPSIREDRSCVALESPEGQERWKIPLSVFTKEGLREQFNEIYYGDQLSQEVLVIGILDMEEEKWLP